MSTGSELLIVKYGSPLKIAEALLQGKLLSHEQDYVSEVVSQIILEAAKWRLEQKPQE